MQTLDHATLGPPHHSGPGGQAGWVKVPAPSQPYAVQPQAPHATAALAPRLASNSSSSSSSMSSSSTSSSKSAASSADSRAPAPLPLAARAVPARPYRQRQRCPLTRPRITITESSQAMPLPHHVQAAELCRALQRVTQSCTIQTCHPTLQHQSTVTSAACQNMTRLA